MLLLEIDDTSASNLDFGVALREENKFFFSINIMWII